MKLKLEARPNPDYPGDYRGMVNIPAIYVNVESFKQASGLCREFIIKNMLGSGNWTGGEITGDNNQVLANISYNGKVWDYPSGKLIYTLL